MLSFTYWLFLFALSKLRELAEDFIDLLVPSNVKIFRLLLKRHGKPYSQALDMLKTSVAQFVFVMLFSHLWDTRLQCLKD